MYLKESVTDGEASIEFTKPDRAPSMMLLGIRVKTSAPDMNGYYAGWHETDRGVAPCIMRRSFGVANILKAGSPRGIKHKVGGIQLSASGPVLRAIFLEDGIPVEALSVIDDARKDGEFAFGRCYGIDVSAITVLRFTAAEHKRRVNLQIMPGLKKFIRKAGPEYALRNIVDLIYEPQINEV